MRPTTKRELNDLSDFYRWTVRFSSRIRIKQGTNRAAGGDCRYELFENSEHEWTGKPGPQTTRAQDMVKAFIARNVSA